MKPNRPRAIASSRGSITVEWDSCDSLILKNRCNEEKVTTEETEVEKDKDSKWYLLQIKNPVLGWCRAYMGFKTQAEVKPLSPGDYYEFRLKVKTKNKESDWSDALFALTKDDYLTVAELQRTVENGPPNILRKSLSQRPMLANVPNKFGHTALTLAVLRNNTDFMGILLNNGAKIGHVEPGSGRTYLMIAAAKGHLEAVQLLLEKGSSWTIKDRNGLTAFNYAIENSHFEIVKLAVKESNNFLTKDNFGWTPLMRGVILKASPSVISHLLENGSNPNEYDDRQQTVLMQAVLSGRPETVELLIEKGADIDLKNIYGYSAYDFAKHSSSEGIQKVLHLLTKEKQNLDEKVSKKEKPQN